MVKLLNSLPEKIPVFPLSNFIIFPETTVPLNIFEKRYIEMIDDAMKQNRMIGMIQPKKTNNNIPEAKICNELGIKLVDNLGEKIQSSSKLIEKCRKM